jgi:hypothetical protein
VKILFNNALNAAVYTSVNAAGSFPAGNLSDGFLRLRYQVDGTADTVTITLSESVSVDCFFMSYIGNISDIDVTFFSGDVARLVTLGPAVGTGDADTIVTGDGDTMHYGEGPSNYFDDYAGEQTVSRTFDVVTSIDKIVIALTGTNPFYIGGVAAGLCEDIPPALAAWDDTYNDNSVSVRSSHGQVQALYIEPVRSYGFSFDAIPTADFVRIKAAAQSVGPIPVWVSFFEDSPDAIPPGYYQVTMEGQRRSMYTYAFNMQFTEAR